MTMARFLLATCIGMLPFAPYVTSYAVPKVIQGGMGVRISSWKLAREVARTGELGMISGTAMEQILVRTLQDGDPGGAFRKALASFPDQEMASRILDKYFIEGGKEELAPYKTIPMWTLQPPQSLLEACIVANFCEVWLAKHNDDGSTVPGSVGINLLTKVQLPTVPSLYGAMLADVDFVLMGAGIPMHIPGILDNLSECQDCKQPIEVDGASGDQQLSFSFSPSGFWEAAGNMDLADIDLKRPAFVPIVSSPLLAQSMLKRANGKGETKGIQGFVVELNRAGGHNAPPRGFHYDAAGKSHVADLSETGEPVYGPKDEVDALKFLKAAKGLPFWFAGSYGKPDKFNEVLNLGGAGVQVGTMFALSRESGMEDGLKQQILSKLAEGDLEVFTDPDASPTGFPFKVLQIEDTLSDENIYNARPRVCSLGYLRSPYIRPDGKVGYRCPSEPVDAWVKKGGDIHAIENRKCLCNGLLSEAGFPQVTQQKEGKSGEKYIEKPLVTIGDDVNCCRRFLKKDENGQWGYSAKEVVEYLKSEWDSTAGNDGGKVVDKEPVLSA